MGDELSAEQLQQLRSQDEHAAREKQKRADDRAAHLTKMYAAAKAMAPADPSPVFAALLLDERLEKFEKDLAGIHLILRNRRGQ